MNFVDIANDGVAGLSVYEPGRPLEEVARELGFESADEIDKLASNENELGPSPRAIEAMKANVDLMHRYPDGGAYYLKMALAEKLALSPECFLPVNGSNEAIEFLAHVFLGPGRSIVMADHAFVVYRLMAAMFGAEVISVPMKDYTHDLSAMRDAIRDDTKIVFISNPNNPTSTMVGGCEIDKFMSEVPAHVVVCFDEAYIELLKPEMQPDTMKYVRAGRNVVLLRTFSKTYGLAGLRIGYAIAPPECISLLNRVRQPFNVNSMALAAAVAALGDDDHVERSRVMMHEGLDYLQGEFERMGLEYVPAAANFILVKTDNGREVFEKLQSEGVIVRPMDGYGLGEFIRVTVGVRDQNERFIRALRKELGLEGSSEAGVGLVGLI